jgi:L-iditol 2-dehydrogenase
MKAAVFYGPGDLRVESVPEPEPGPGELVVKVGAATTCGTDVKSYRRGHPTIFPNLPSLFGHEFAGRIEAVGDGVTDFTVGMRVVSANSAPCGSCFYCSIGRESLCEHLQMLHGAFAERIRVPAPIVAKNTHVLPDGVGDAEAAMVEPLACVVHGIAESPIEVGHTVAVNGVGPIGLMFVRLAGLRGARVIAVDPSPARLEVAEAMGADVLVRPEPDDDVSAAVRRLTPAGRGVDVAVEAVGLPETWEQTIAQLRKGGTAVLFGGAKSGTSISVDTVAMHYSEYTLKGVFHHAPRYVRAAVDLLVTRRVDGRLMLSGERPLDELVAALDDMGAQRGLKYSIVA